MASWLDWLNFGASAVSAWGGWKAGQDAGDYYSTLADIQGQNAAISKANRDLALDYKGKKEAWDLAYADIDYANAGARYEHDLAVLENEEKFNAYMEALAYRHSAEIADIAKGTYVGEKKIAEEAETLRQTTATQTYDQEMDRVRHIVAETSAKGAKSGFKINAGSFMSALSDETGIANLYATGTRESAFEAARLNKESSILSAEGTYRRGMMSAEDMTATGERYALAGKINLEDEKLAGALYGGAGERRRIAGEQYDFGMGQIGSYRTLSDQAYGLDMQTAGLTRRRASDVREGSWFNAAIPFIKFANAMYGKG